MHEAELADSDDGTGLMTVESCLDVQSFQSHVQFCILTFTYHLLSLSLSASLNGELFKEKWPVHVSVLLLELDAKIL